MRDQSNMTLEGMSPQNSSPRQQAQKTIVSFDIPIPPKYKTWSIHSYICMQMHQKVFVSTKHNNIYVAKTDRNNVLRRNNKKKLAYNVYAHSLSCFATRK